MAGVTLIELLVAIAIVAILLTLGLPGFQQSLRSNRASTATNEFLSSLNLARSEAIRNANGSGICPSSDGTTCGTDWSEGWLVWSDDDGNGALNGAERILRVREENAHLDFTGSTSAAITFDGRGRSQTAGAVVVIRPEECGDQPLQRTLTVNASGQVSTIKGACS